MYREYRNDRNQLHRAGGPAVEADDRKEWWAEGRRHREDGPAVETVGGTIWYYWRGVLVPKECILDPRSKEPRDILKIQNIEVRRAWMEAYGLEAFMETMNPIVLDDDKKRDMALVKIDLPEDEPLVMVRVTNSTPEPDGHYKKYFIRVSPDCKTAWEGVSWTFNMKPEEYAPSIET